MANPAVTACAKGVWTKIATNVTNGIISILKSETDYLQTYRMTGVAAPTLKSEGVRVAMNQIVIAATAGIDVYLWAEDADGSVRVDL